MDLTLQRRDQQDKTVVLGDGLVNVVMTPNIDDDYWTYRVAVSDKQAIVGFPKFGTIGIGFQKEEDWNTNLPYTCETDEIYNHILHNRTAAGDDPDWRLCVVAIDMIQKAATSDRS